MNNKLGLTVLVAVLAVVLSGGAALAQPVASTTDTQTMFDFGGGDTGGLSHLTRVDDTLLLEIDAADLVAGHVYTIWWIVFNNPVACSAPGCGADDFFDDSPNGLNDAQIILTGNGIGNATGNVAKSDGTAEFGAKLTVDMSNDHQVLWGAGFGPDILTADPDDVEVHVVVQKHSQGRGGPQLLRQLSEVFFGCTPACEDIQFAVHAP